MRCTSCFTVGAFLLLVSTAAADEPPHLEFVRGLRERQLPDLALEYLQELGKKKLPADVAALLPLELAKTQLELANLEDDEGRRAGLRAQARAQFQAFLKASAKHPRAAEANLEIARMAALEGKAQLARARRQDEPKARRSELLKARARFEEAGNLLKAAAAGIDTQLKAITDPKTPQEQADRQALAQAKLQAEFELGLNLLDQAQTYTADAELAKRGEIVKSALGVLEKVAGREARNPLCWEARAWIGRCYHENDDPKSARKYYQDVIAEAGDHAESGRRLARYFRMETMAKDPDPKKPALTLAQIQDAGERWLNDYKKYRNSPEGQGVRFALANAYLRQALLLPATQQAQPQGRELLNRAQRLFQELEQTENEYTEVARENKLNILLKVSTDASRGDISKLRNFEECYLRAQFEVALLNKAEKDGGPKLEAQRKEHLSNMLTALNRAFDLADAKVPPQDFSDARYLLARTYFATDDLYRAAVVGEDLARTAPQANRAPAASTYALFAYLQLLTLDEQNGAPAEVIEADKARLRSLAEYIAKTWPTDTAADVARHQLGRLHLVEKKYPEAVAILGQITPGYADSIRSLYQLAFAALQADRDGLKQPAGKPPYEDQAIAALKAMPDLPAEADAATAQVYLEGKLTLGTILYGKKDFAQMEAIATNLTERIGMLQGVLDNQVRADLDVKATGLKLLAQYGRAEADYAAGQYTKVRDGLEPLVKQLRTPAEAARLAQLKDPGLLPALLGLAVRANVQDNKIDKAREILDALQKSSPQNYLEILKQLVLHLRVQIQELRGKGESVKAQLEQTVSNFSTFLDQLAKQQEKSPQPEMLLFLAQSYSSLDNHKRAAELLEQVAEPPATADKPADPKDVQVYRAARILAARELRLDKQYDKAQTVLNGILGTPDKPGWGQSNLDAQKERLFLLQDQEKYTAAIPGWNALLKQMQPRLKQDAKVKEQYFECYYHLTHSLYRYAGKVPDEKKKQSYTRQAANYIVQLETTQPDMGSEAVKKLFDDLLKTEAPLREQYEALKKGTP